MKTARLGLAVAAMLVSSVLWGCGGSGPPAGVSAACNAAWTANEKPGGGGASDELMAVTFTACSNATEWKAGFAAHPLAHGSAVDPEVFLATRCSSGESDLGDVTQTLVCRNR